MTFTQRMLRRVAERRDASSIVIAAFIAAFMFGGFIGSVYAC